MPNGPTARRSKWVIGTAINEILKACSVAEVNSLAAACEQASEEDVVAKGELELSRTRAKHGERSLNECLEVASQATKEFNDAGGRAHDATKAVAAWEAYGEAALKQADMCEKVAAAAWKAAAQASKYAYTAEAAIKSIETAKSEAPKSDQKAWGEQLKTARERKKSATKGLKERLANIVEVAGKAHGEAAMARGFMTGVRSMVDGLRDIHDDQPVEDAHDPPDPHSQH